MEYFQDRSLIFDNEDVLAEEYKPDSIPEREDELSKIGAGLSPGLNNGTPNNLFIQGRSGQGKTIAARFILELFEERAEERNVDLTTMFTSCASASSTYQVACELVERETDVDPNGHRKRKVFGKLFNVLDEIGGTIVIVLDEIDSLGTDDDLLYELSRARDNGHVDNCRVSLIGISNNLNYISQLSTQTRDSLGETIVNFDPYDAQQLEAIVSRRVEKGFNDGVVSNSAIRLCAAYAAQDTGSARQAIEYLAEAGEVALNQGDSSVTDSHVRVAEENVDLRKVVNSITGLTNQDHLTLAAVVAAEKRTDGPVKTRAVYSKYSEICEYNGQTKIALDRVRDHLKELKTLGMISGTLRSDSSVGGKKYFWELQMDMDSTIDVLADIDRLGDALEYVL